MTTTQVFVGVDPTYIGPTNGNRTGGWDKIPSTEHE